MSQCHNVSANNVKMLLRANCLGSAQIRNVTMQWLIVEPLWMPLMLCFPWICQTWSYWEFRLVTVSKCLIYLLTRNFGQTINLEKILNSHHFWLFFLRNWQHTAWKDKEFLFLLQFPPEWAFYKQKHLESKQSVSNQHKRSVKNAVKENKLCF